MLVNSGDLSNNGKADDFKQFFLNQKKPFLWASGNHDRYNSDTVKVMGRPNDFYQKVGRVGFFVLFFEDSTFNIFKDLIAQHINDSDVDH